MKMLMGLICAYFLVFNPSVSYADRVKSASDLGQALQTLAKIKGFSCQFEQVLSYAEGGKRVYSGTLAVLRPGKFRWEYTKPYVQLYVGNGDDIWLYEPDLMQAQHLQDLGEVEPIVMQLLDGRVGLADVQVLATKQLTPQETSWLVSVGQGEQKVEIYLGTIAKSLAWIESRDMLGNHNRLRLLQMKMVAPALDIFEFKAPQGVDVIGALQ